MTSTAPTNPVVPNATAPATSYASAASKKQQSTPLIATGTTPQVVVGSTPNAAATQHGSKPMNGRPQITPAIPTVGATPAVAHGNPNTAMNGGPAQHARSSSVTLNPSGPTSFIPNGGNLAAPKANMPQFGYESPAMPHSTPQPPTSAPIPIPAAGNPRVPSPTHSPVPIPQTSGGPVRETSGAKPVFGSHRDDGERHMRQNIPPANAAPHMRTGSHPMNDGPSGRGGFQGNRGGHHGGRGGFHPQQSPYGQPIQPYTGPHYGGQPGRGAGRGGMPQFSRGPYPNSPRMQSNSPAPGHAMPAANSPVPAHAMPAPGAYYGGAPPPHPQQYGGPPMHMNQFAYGQPMGQTFFPGFNPQMNPYVPPPQPPMGGYSPAAAPFQPGQSFAQAGGQPMSRQGSQVSATDNRPGSSGPPPQGPVIVSGSQPQMTQAKAPVVSGASFQIPKKKSAAIPIMNELGQTINLNQLKPPASPVPGVTKSKTPPVPSKTPTPEPKSTSASTIKPEGTSQPQTEDERRAAFKIQIQKAKEEAEAKAKEEAEAKARQEAEARAKQEAEAKAAAEMKAKEEAEAKAKAEAEAKAKQEAEAKAAAEAKAKEEAEAKARAEAEAKAKEEAEAAAKAKEEAEKATAAASRPTLADLDAKNAAGIDLTPEEWDIYYELMDEQDAEREAEQSKINEQKKAEKEAAKAKEESDRVKNAAENDRKLREAEAEMERLEEEKERKRREAEEKGTVQSVTDQLKASIEGLKAADKPDAASSVSSVTSKLADLKLSKVSPAVTKTGSQKQKPAALNLAPLNTGSVEAPQPSAALQSLKSARFLTVMSQDIYPAGIMSPNPAVNPAAAGKKAPFRYDMNFMLQFRVMCKEPPSMDFSQQVKTLIGEDGGSRSASAKTPAGSGRQNSRAGSSGFSAMGSFGAPMGRTLPPGTSSEARFAMSSGSLPRPAPPAMGSFNRPGFPGGTSMSRTPSSTNMGPNSPRQGSRRGGSSKPHHNITKAEEKANKSMPLTQGMDLKPLFTSGDGWKPTSVGKRAPAASGDGILDPAMVQRKVKAALNKMTPDNFDRISEQILEIAQQSKQENDGRTLRQVIQLTFEKATDEAHWASMYARFCRRMLDTMSPEIRDENIVDKNNVVVSGGALFRKYLLNRCQEEFERGWKVNLPEPKEAEGDKKSMEAAMLSDEYYIAAAAKRRGLGLVQFIGELYKLGMLTERIMHECVRKLLDFSGIPDEAEIESLSKLLKTIGSNLDSTEKGRPMMDVYFDRIKSVLDLPDLASRMKFMLMDVVDLRRAGWHSKEDNKGPKTLDEIRADVEAQNAQKAAEAARGSQRGGAGGRPPVGRGDARQFSGAGYNNQAGQNQIGMDDLRRLKGNNTTRSSSHNITLGPSSMLFASRSNSKRGLGPNTSLGRGNDDSGNNSRTSTPTQKASTNVYQLLSALDNDPTSPPSTAPSPNISKATTATEDEKKKD